MAERPKHGEPGYSDWAELFNDITRTEHGSARRPLFSVRHRIAEHLWALGYRKTEGNA